MTTNNESTHPVVYLSSLILFVFTQITGAYVLYALGLGTNFITFISILSLTFFVNIKCIKKRKEAVKGFLVSCLMFFSSLGISSLFKDFSYDGRNYQSEAIYQIHFGWNPLLERITPDKWDSSYSIWLNTLSKFQWILAELPLDLGFGLNSTKYLNLIACCILFLTGLTVGKEFNLRKHLNLMLSFCFMLCPPVLAQIYSGYKDALPIALTISAISMCMIVIVRKDLNSPYFKLFCLISVLAVSSKLSQLIFIFLMVLALIVMFYKKLKGKKPLTFFGFSLCFSLILFNFNPYLVNLFHFGNPTYPMSTSNWVLNERTEQANILSNSVRKNLQQEIYEGNTPQALKPIPVVLRNFASPFLKTNDYIPGDTLRNSVKQPTQIGVNEFIHSAYADIRVGGYGPLFFLIFVLLLVGLLQIKSLGKFLLLASPVILGVALTPYGWWTRYSGAGWAIVLIGILILLINSRNKFFMYVPMILIILQGSLTVLIGAAMNSNSKESQSLNDSRNALGSVVVLDLTFPGERFLQFEKGSKFVFDRIESDFYFNHVDKKLTNTDRKIYGACYPGLLQNDEVNEQNDMVISRDYADRLKDAANKTDRSAQLFNTGEVFLISRDNCDFQKLGLLELLQTPKGLNNVSIFQMSG